MVSLTKSWLGKLAAGGLFVAIGAAFAAYVVGVRVLNPFDISWLADDPATGYLGWKFFRLEEHLSFPLGWASKLGYPLGEPIAYLDSLPLVATMLCLSAIFCRPIFSISAPGSRFA